MANQEAAEKRLYDAAAIGNLETFNQVLQQHLHLLDVVSFPCLKNVLHIAIMQGHCSIVDEVLEMKPQLARDLDSKNSSSLHIAAAQGNVEIVKKLIEVAPEMCWWRDCHDMNPVHIAAMKGHEAVLTKLLERDSLPAMERVYRGQTVLHLCVKHRQLETLKVLANKLGELACAKDDDGETVLHLAVRCKQFEMIQYLVENNKIEKLTTNSMDKTAVDILNECPPDIFTRSRVRRILNSLSDQSMLNIFSKVHDTAMVVVVLIATMAFQATINPPGGVWQGDTASHSAGEAVMASIHPKLYKHFSRANTTAFIASLITIFLISIEGPLGNFYFMGYAILAMWVSMASIGVSYGASLIMTNPIKTQSIGHVVAIVVSIILGILVLLFIVSGVHEFYLSWKRKIRQGEDLTTAPLILRVFYRMFQIFKSSEDLPTIALARLMRSLSIELDPPARQGSP